MGCVVTVVLLAAVVAVAGIGAVRVVRRNLADERTSVRHYQHTLDALRHASDQHDPPGRPEASPRSPGPGRDALTTRLPDMAALEARRPVASGVGSGVASGPEADTTSGYRTAAPARAIPAVDAVRQLVATGARYGSGPRRLTMPRARRADRRPLLATVTAVVVVGTLTGVAVALHPAPGPSSPGAVDHGGATVGAVAKSSTSTKAPTGKPTSPKKPAPSGPHGLAPVTASTTEATYDVPGAPYSVTLSASGPCWAEAVDVSTGQVVWEGTLEAGQSETVPATTGLFLRLGNTPAVTVTAGGQTVQLPAGYATVFDLTFVTA